MITAQVKLKEMNNKQCLILILSFQLLLFLLYYRQNEDVIWRRRRLHKLHCFLHQVKKNIHVYYKKKIRKSNTVKRSTWMKVRSADWWSRIVQKNFLEEDWLENFRISRPTFEYICNRLRKYLAPAETQVREPTSVEKQVAVALYKLASCAEYRIIANQFGISKSSVHKYLYAFCNAVNIEFNDYLTMPNELEVMDITREFESICGIPNIIGAIDGTHVPILPPKDGYRDFINRKGWPSYNVLAIVDNAYMYVEKYELPKCATYKFLPF